MANSNKASVKQLSYGNPDGATMARSALEKLGFYGATPVAQQTVTGIRLGTEEAVTVSLLTALVDLGLIIDETTAQ